MRAFEQAQLDQLHRELVSHVRRTDSEIPPSLDLERAIAEAVHDSVKLNFSKRADAARYVLLLYLLGPDFKTDPSRVWFRNILDNPNMPLEKKMAAWCAYGEASLGARFQKVMTPRV